MRRLFAIAAVALFLPAAPLLAQAAPIDLPAGAYALDKTHASVTWRISHLGLSYYTARFVSFDSTVTLDPKDPTRSSVMFTIDPKSVRTDYPFPEKENFDQVIASKFLLGDKHPEIRFQSTALQATGAKTGKLKGNMTMAGVTKPVTFDVTLNGAMMHPMLKVPVLGFSAKGSLKRSDFGLTELQGVLGDTIEIAIEAEYQKAS